MRCESQKIGYASKEAALGGAEASMLKGLVQPGCHLTPYLCVQCDEWHLFNRRIVRVSGVER